MEEQCGVHADYSCYICPFYTLSLVFLKDCISRPPGAFYSKLLFYPIKQNLTDSWTFN